MSDYQNVSAANVAGSKTEKVSPRNLRSCHAGLELRPGFTESGCFTASTFLGLYPDKLAGFAFIIPDFRKYSCIRSTVGGGWVDKVTIGTAHPSDTSTTYTSLASLSCSTGTVPCHDHYILLFEPACNISGTASEDYFRRNVDTV